jgi:Uma2 family endonuclease
MSIAERLQSATPDRRPVSVADYLADELTGRVKHEYVGGTAHMMSGARNTHNIIGANILVSFAQRLKGKSCRAFNSDTKIRIRLPQETRFYYPDALVVRRQNPQNDSFQDEPVVVAEVLSRSTRRYDEGEKKDAYFTIPSLAVYLLVEQDSAEIIAYRRTEKGFVREAFQGLQAVVPLTAEIECELPLADVYDGVVFTPEPDPQVG